MVLLVSIDNPLFFFPAKLGHALTPWAQLIIYKKASKSVTWTVHPISMTVFEVRELINKVVVDLQAGTCF